MFRLLLLVPLITVAVGSAINDPSTSIINGDLANIEDYPFYAYLRYKNIDILLCGGALIEPDLVLTAAHCMGPHNFSVYTGVTDEEDLKTAKEYEVEKYAIHPLYETDNTSRYDIAVVKLTENVTFGAKVQLIRLATSKPGVDEQTQVVGFGKPKCDLFFPFWGDQCLNAASDHLRSATMTVTSLEDDVIESRGKNQNVCYGDSGGPMVYDNKVVGVASTVDFQDCSGGNTYTSVPDNISWLKKYMKQTQKESSEEFMW